MISSFPEADSRARAEVLDLEEARQLSEPPNSVQAEEAVLGSVLKNPLSLASVLPFLKAHHFYAPRHRHIYAAMTALFERAAVVDYHTIGEELTRQGTYAAAGGLENLAEIDLATPSAAYIEDYARIVLEHAVRRRYISAGQQVAELAWNRRKDLDEVKHLAEAAVLGASSDTLSRRAVLSPEDWTTQLMDYLGRARIDGLAGVSTGLHDLDRMTLGLSPGLYLLAASTGTGKTALAGQIALHVAEQHGPVIFVSMELTAVDLGVQTRVGHHQHRQRAAHRRQTDRGPAAAGAGEHRAAVAVETAHGVRLGVHELGRARVRVAGAGQRGCQTCADRGGLRAVAARPGG